MIFQTDWNDGRALCSLVKSLGASAKYEESEDTSVWLSNLNSGIYNRMRHMLRLTRFIFIEKHFRYQRWS